MMRRARSHVEEALLVLKIAFLVLLYLFIWRIVRTASRDLRLPQESFVLTPGSRPRRRAPASAALETGPPRRRSRARRSTRATSSCSTRRAITIGRGAQNDVSLDGDEFASARHARFEPRRDGVWLEDVGSTNGTYVNGVRLDAARGGCRRRRLRVGETELRFEP